jgi:hypothetical protein
MRQRHEQVEGSYGMVTLKHFPTRRTLASGGHKTTTDARTGIDPYAYFDEQV